jgi:saccharopine dehydrogenase-like NADP-dependent oxidoreductase
MKQILVLGAGKSAPYLIHYLLEHAEEEQWQVSVGDLDLKAAEATLLGHPHGRAIQFDMTNTSQVDVEFEKADIVMSMLPPFFQYPIARACLDHHCHMVTVSYTDPRTRALHEEAKSKGLLLLNELGLDPGMDHMSAAKMVRDIREEGGRILGFKSYGSGVPAPESIDNPLQYVITWNPHNVALAGGAGAIYRYMKQTKVVPGHRVFEHTWPVEVEGVGPMEAYPNRDSLEYLEAFGLEHVDTMIRGTLRHMGYAETWQQIVSLGLNNDTVKIPNLSSYTYRDVLRMFLPLTGTGQHIEARTAKLLGISPTGAIMRNLTWLGIFSREKVRTKGHTCADMLTDLLLEKLPLHSDKRDMVVLLHEFDVEFEDGRLERRTSTMVHKGSPGGFTAMACTVGLPAGIAVKLILRDQITLRGSAIPLDPSIYEPSLRELDDAGIRFVESKSRVDPKQSVG